MKVTVSYEGDYYEDGDEMRTVMLASEMRSKIFEVQQHLRAKIKWTELTENECKLLEEVREMLYIYGLE